MKNELLLIGVLLVLMMFLVGCIESSNSGNQGTGTQGEIQQPSPQGGGKQTEQDASQPGSRGGMGATFVRACDGKTEGDDCAITFGNQTIDGKCTSREGNITCMPNNNSMGQRSNVPRGPGAGFIEACREKAEGEACTLTMRDQTVDGTCTNRAGNLTCTPNNMGLDQRQRNPDNVAVGAERRGP